MQKFLAQTEGRLSLGIKGLGDSIPLDAGAKIQ